MLDLFELQYTNKPCAMVFDVQGNYKYYPIRLIKRRLFILKEFGVVAHINPAFGNKRYRGRKSTWFFDMAKSNGAGSPFDPQQKFNPNALLPLKGQSRLRIRQRSLAKLISRVTPNIKLTSGNDEPPKYEESNSGVTLEEPRPFTKKEAKNLEEQLTALNGDEARLQYLEDNGIAVIENITMEGVEFEDDGGFDDEDVLFSAMEELLQLEKQARDLSSKPLKSSFKWVIIVPIVFAIVIVMVALPNIINGLGDIKMPSLPTSMFTGGKFILGLTAKMPFLSNFI